MEVLLSLQSDDESGWRTVRANFDRTATLGRGPESLVPLDGIGISREHVEICVSDGRLSIRDLSSNGTWVNSRRLNHGEKHWLDAADKIRIPGFNIRVSSADTPTPDESGRPQAMPSSDQPFGEKQASRPPGPIAQFTASLGKLEKMLIALAVATFVFVLIYTLS
jgi:predicted component of type VI protein secretion system